MSDIARLRGVPGANAPSARSVLLTIAGKEALELLRDRRFAWIAALFTLLMLVAMLLGWQQMQRIEAEHAAAHKESYAQWRGQGEKNPHSAAHFGQHAFKPSSPLLFIDPGITPFVGASVWMEAHKQNEFKFRPARDATSLQRFGDLSVAFVLQTLAPLIIILMTFSAFTGERERGTLRQLISIGVRPMPLLGGKTIAVAGILCLLTLPFAMIALVALPFLPDPDIGMDNALQRAILMAAGYATYLTGFCTLSLAVSALAHSSRAALVMLLAFWVANSFIVPRTMVDLARLVSPTPTAVEFQHALSEARKANFGHDDTHPEYLRFREETLKRYGASSVEQLPLDFDGLALREDDERGYRLFDRHFEALWDSYARQEAIRSLAGFIFPLAAMQPVSMGLAGSDIGHHNDFARAAETYRRHIQTVTSEDLIRNRKYGDKDYKAGPELWAAVQAFDYRPPDAGWALRQQGFNLLILSAWTLAATLLAVYATRRLSPV
ncbi:DUF3526 domain-containing protein [Nitrosovibrio sp. Nv17]|jgi:ABC-2 type transport system permease protein|uniref:DUF3526 domain-containing protein n=1 Tax=Nitrosovibrio sp. Nv17 TaxID=1855339 RepID=UPI000908C54F|nr:DUF3526 domain-containing protein [Nitrosovibrio sp. Nv17]SFW27109.1 ABC-2 type transport system permease protein [Nitrosovibrio sp. Nv17]